MVKNIEKVILDRPKNQLNLYGYENHFNFFINIIKKGKLPNVTLLSGQKGLGKSTFIYHLANYILSINEKSSYSLENFRIDPKPA